MKLVVKADTIKQAAEFATIRGFMHFEKFKHDPKRNTVIVYTTNDPYNATTLASRWMTERGHVAIGYGYVPGTLLFYGE